MANNDLLQYVLQLADNSMILGQRLGEWCGHGPAIEQDIALTNISLDLIGEARMLYQYAAEIEGNGKTEDDYPYLRDAKDWRNLLLVELPIGDFAHTIVRQFMFDCYHYYHLQALKSSSDERLRSIAEKTAKESAYHIKFSSEWMLRLGDGTEESHQKMQAALISKSRYFEEAFIPSKIENKESLKGIAVDPQAIKSQAMERFLSTCKRATLDFPEVKFPQKGGKDGVHTEHLGFILADLQYLQKTYPGVEW